ncbi:MAG TPA: ABC transporter substrate-binding protein [Casimicrobiaceae bacterium]|nr:ABC transporter substrate-binding protein [Casimicrobiaceae bacterium]
MAAFESVDPLHHGSRRTRRKLLHAVFCGLAMGAAGALRAQSARKVWRIGFLASDSSTNRVHEGFRQGMRELGLVDGRDFVVEWRFADGNYERLPGLAKELVSRDVDVIVAATTLSVQAARQATVTTPIVMVAVPDPVGEGFATRLSRPGKNITGLSNLVTEVSVKHVELMHAAVPRLSRMAVLINPLNPSDALILEQVEGAAYNRRLKVATFEASTAGQIDAAFAAMAQAKVEALIVAADAYFDVQRDRIVQLALRNRLPTMSSSREMTEAGGLMSYGQDLAEHYRRAATYVDKIMKGANPGALPVEQPTVLEFIVNLKTAAAIGLSMPREVVLRADRMIE